jgi:hypothetical protein
LKNAFFNIERLGAIVRRYRRINTAILQPAARRAADRSLLRRMVDRFAARARHAADGGPQGPEGTRTGDPPHQIVTFLATSRDSLRRQRGAPAQIQKENARNFERLRTGLAVTASSAATPRNLSAGAMA